MAACVHCHRTKGKRSCPALSGQICSACCGQYRLKTIACPSDCVWLGGLALVREELPIGDFPKSALNEAVAQLGAFCRSSDEIVHSAAAGERFFGSEPAESLEEWADNLFTGHVFYGQRDARGRRAIDRFAERRGRDLGREVATAVRSLRASWASLFEVGAVHRGAGFELRDLLGDEQTLIREVSGSHQVTTGDCLYGWLMPVGDHVEGVGIFCSIPQETQPLLRDLLHQAMEGATSRQRGVEVAPLVYAALSEAVANRPRPRIQNTDGDELTFCKAHYSVTDAPALRRRLAELPGMHAEEHGFAWSRATDKPGFGGEVTLGHFTLGDGELEWETNSQKRLLEGKQLLAQHAAELAHHRIDSVQSLESLMREPRRRGGERISDELQAEVGGQMLREHYATWADIALPALGGKTPRQATRTKKGRAKLEALLDDIERGTLTQPGGETVDFGALRSDLGLDDLELDWRYDPSRDPDDDWLERDEDERGLAVEAYHQKGGKHPPMPNPRLHATVHVIVENQLAMGQPKAVRSTLARLMNEGLSRHEALHAIGEVVADDLFQVMKEGKAVDVEATGRKLARLGPGDHRGSAPDRARAPRR